jgi:hypothetical protein
MMTMARLSLRVVEMALSRSNAMGNQREEIDGFELTLVHAALTTNS